MYYSSTIKYEISHTLTERFVHTYGFEKEGVWFYPPPKRTAEIEVGELRNLQFSQRKAEYFIGYPR
jgi:DNA-3-methyladenine glycosylase II